MLIFTKNESSVECREQDNPFQSFSSTHKPQPLSDMMGPSLSQSDITMLATLKCRKPSRKYS